MPTFKDGVTNADFIEARFSGCRFLKLDFFMSIFADIFR